MVLSSTAPTRSSSTVQCASRHSAQMAKACPSGPKAPKTKIFVALQLQIGVPDVHESALKEPLIFISIVFLS